MEYCYSGTESLWYGSWNRHVCRKGKCAADRYSRSTGVNPKLHTCTSLPSCTKPFPFQNAYPKHATITTNLIPLSHYSVLGQRVPDVSKHADLSRMRYRPWASRGFVFHLWPNLWLISFDRYVDKCLGNVNFKSVSWRIFEILSFEKSRKGRKMVH